jgi:hypothetical protein
VRPGDIFDVCLETVRRYQLSLGAPGAIRTDACAKDGPGQTGNRRAEYIADFGLAARRALTHDGRRRLFALYYLDGVPYRIAIRVLKLKPGTFDRWCYEVRRSVGKELARAGLFPPRHYGLRTQPPTNDDRSDHDYAAE